MDQGLRQGCVLAPVLFDIDIRACVRLVDGECSDISDMDQGLGKYASSRHTCSAIFTAVGVVAVEFFSVDEDIL